MPETPSAYESTTSPVLLLLAWSFVGLPLAWGITQTIIKSMALFE